MVTPNFPDKSTTKNPPRLLDQVRDKLRVKHYSIRTEQTYLDWIKRYIYFHGKRHPKDMEARDVEAFLTHLAVAGKVSASTQNQAKSALLFLYREVLEIKLPWLDNVTQAKAPRRLPVVLTISEVQSVLSRLKGTHALIASLLYGGGMRLMEAVRLRVKDVDFARHEILVREGKGFKDRVTMLPESVTAALKAHMVKVKALHEEDLAQGYGEVYLPFALDKKYPNVHGRNTTTDDETRHARFPLPNPLPQAGEEANESLREFDVTASREWGWHNQRLGWRRLPA
jgi:integron integrase